MWKLGAVVDISSPRGLIIRAGESFEVIPEINAKVFTKKMDLVGRIFDVFGPVKQPYISVKLNKGNTGMELLDLKGESVYLE